jgi:hypothetical protein
MKRVEIIWQDIVHESGWHTVEELEDFNQTKDKTVYQLGYLYEEDEDEVTIVDSFFEDKKTFGTIHIIPKGCIKQMKEI